MVRCGWTTHLQGVGALFAALQKAHAFLASTLSFMTADRGPATSRDTGIFYRKARVLPPKTATGSSEPCFARKWQLLVWCGMIGS